MLKPISVQAAIGYHVPFAVLTHLSCGYPKKLLLIYVYISYTLCFNSTYKWSSFVLIALQITSTFTYLWKGVLDNLLATRLLQCCKVVTRLLEPQYFHKDKLASKRYSLFSNSKHAKIICSIVSMDNNRSDRPINNLFS